jgi:hypothetical protein
LSFGRSLQELWALFGNISEKTQAKFQADALSYIVRIEQAMFGYDFCYALASQSLCPFKVD